MCSKLCKMQLSVRGRLRKHSQFWIEELKPSSFVNAIVISGYWLLVAPFLRHPNAIVKANYSSAKVNCEFFLELAVSYSVRHVTMCVVHVVPSAVVRNVRWLTFVMSISFASTEI